MITKEELEKIEKQINKKKEDLVKNQEQQKIKKKQLSDLKNREKTINNELTALQNEYLRKTLDYNNMTFEEFKELMNKN